MRILERVQPWLFKFSKSADFQHFQSLLLALVCQDLYSLLHYFGYKKIKGLIIGKKHSLEVRADAFSPLKRLLGEYRDTKGTRY